MNLEKNILSYDKTRILRRIDMTIIMIEATAEELSANRSVMDNVSDILNTFADRVCGIDTRINRNAIAQALAEEENDEE